MNIHFWLSGLLTTTTLAIALGSGNSALARPVNAPALGTDTDLPTGNSQDLNGLEEREVDDWFPQNGISGGQAPGVLEINKNSPPSSIVNPQLIRNQNDEWINHTSGDPKQSGAGIPLGEF